MRVGRRRATEGMRSYWDDRARENAAWYVDTTLSFDEPDMDQFWLQGERIVAAGLGDAHVALERKEVAVEIGSGLGRNCRALAARFDRVIGLDISEEMVRRSRELVPDPAVRFDLVDGASMAPVADASVDLVFSFTVFQHIPKRAVIGRYIAEAGRVLRSQGLFVFQWNNEPGHRRWIVRRLLLSALQRSGLRSERYRRHAPEFLGSRVPLKWVDQALDRAGFDLVETRETGTLYAWAWARRR
jgi:SAM-dependent methyltransferase